ncbi:TPA: hypothetical protein ACNTBQ_004332 [Escherichia coli]
MVVPVMTGVNTIMREYPNGETTHLTVMAAGFPSLTGDHKVMEIVKERLRKPKPVRVTLDEL